MTMHHYAINWAQQFYGMSEAFPRTLWRIELFLSSGDRYWLGDIKDEWQNAVSFVTEPEGKPVIVATAHIVSMLPVKRTSQQQHGTND